MRILLAFAATAALFSAGCDRRDRDLDYPDTDTRTQDERTPDQGIEQVKDPVSGVMVDKATARKHIHQGREYWFASEENLRMFQENPDRYLSGENETPRETPSETPRDERPSDTPKETPRDDSETPRETPNEQPR